MPLLEIIGFPTRNFVQIIIHCAKYNNILIKAANLDAEPNLESSSDKLSPFASML
jgi:hypothetical protein